ncbi:Siderophore synthetase component [Filimonas lacunae]|uniref:Siderophore synthetase component n=1 Tax=Filimonas lacunae TaxID=477680 RepID=A0A173MD01_9BACT|nr:IucA/IucC family siderophore biosynthesis protein [Filimonas lacunae]BAV05328.1 siderophore synthetase component, ligase [Filimonas lacunae]SIT21950.1 Siderophore synthetase component [Filimonas lacunae]
MEILTSALAQQNGLAHIQPAVWQKATRLLIKKMIAEFAHEQILQPQLTGEKDGWNTYVLKANGKAVEYHFHARVLSLHHWHIDIDSIVKIANGDTALPDALQFMIEFNDMIGISDAMLPVYLEEVAGTLYGSAYILTHNTQSSAMLVHAGYQEIERTMTGHPRFIPNNGRVGFDAQDYSRYAPEAAGPLPLLWIAAHHSRAEFTAIAGLTYQQVIAQELGSDTIQTFEAILKEKGLSAEEYFFMPVHPWQWYNKLITLFTQDIANGYMVCLGAGNDLYQPQQSIRTFFNLSDANKYYVKTALGILNMGYVRILSPYFMRTTPAINEWVYAVTESDGYLKQCGFCVLREVATMGYTNKHYEAALQEDSPYKKMLAALWRESPMSKLQPGQQLMTMAALLHIDTEGDALLPELIKASGWEADAWVKQYLHCYLKPLLHWFYAHDTVFMPHGENLVLVMDKHVPVRAIMKDIGEEVSVMNESVVLPEKAQRIRVTVPEELKTRPVLTQVFDSIFRFIAAILHEQGDYAEDRFWKAVADCIHEYQQQHPHLHEKFTQYHLFEPLITPDGLNRMQILDNRKLRNRDNPFDVPTTGAMTNPVAVFNQEALNGFRK